MSSDRCKHGWIFEVDPFQCPDCRELSEIKTLIRAKTALECYKIATGYLKTCTGQAVADEIKKQFGLEI